MPAILGPDGRPIHSIATAARGNPGVTIAQLRREISQIKARYDAAQTAPGNELHWAMADRLSPNAANQPAVRQRLRSRSRYEAVENNGYLKGAILTICNDFTGSGPKLQVTDKRYTREQRQFIELRFRRWAKLVRLRQKVWRMRWAKIVDGEAFAIMVENSRLDDQVQLDLRIIESDQCTTQGQPIGINPNDYDGVLTNGPENVIKYYFLDYHPGGQTLSIFGQLGRMGQWYDPRWVVHWFRRERPWMRGIPEITPSLALCAMLRRYTLAVVQCAEIAANFSGVIESDAPASSTPFGDLDTLTQDQVAQQFFDEFPVSRGMMLTLPWGMKMTQLKAEQPTSMYDSFVDALLRQIVRPILIPFNYATGFSGGYNFASGTLDKQVYWSAHKTERAGCEEEMLDPLFAQWWTDARDIPGYLTDPTVVSDQPIEGSTEVPEHGWGWDADPDHPDPSKQAAYLIDMANAGHISDRDIQEGRFNRDVEEHYENLRQQEQRRREIGFEPRQSQTTPQQQSADPTQQ